MKLNIYLIVFGIVAVIVIAALLSTVAFNKSTTPKNVSLSSLPDYGPAPNITGISAWINSPPLNLTALRGNVVLVDFWTYSCINCIRSIPFLNDLYNEYHGDGLVIIGVHTPEFQFEHNYTNVLNAVHTFGIQYPVAMDNNYSTWTAFHNEYWPADYLINTTGYIRYESFGEGNFNETANVIKLMLENAGHNVSSSGINFTDSANFSAIGSPEMYLGWQEIANGRTDYLGNSQGFMPNQTVNYTLPSNLDEGNIVYLNGSWYDAPYYIMSAGNESELFLYYKARDVNIVASGNSSLTVMLDGKPLNSSSLGADARIVNGNATVRINSSRLYNLVSTPSYGIHQIEIIAKPGVNIYTFTFG